MALASNGRVHSMNLRHILNEHGCDSDPPFGPTGSEEQLREQLMPPKGITLNSNSVDLIHCWATSSSICRDCIMPLSGLSDLQKKGLRKKGGMTDKGGVISIERLGNEVSEIVIDDEQHQHRQQQLGTSTHHNNHYKDQSPVSSSSAKNNSDLIIDTTTNGSSLLNDHQHQTSAVSDSTTAKNGSSTVLPEEQPLNGESLIKLGELIVLGYNGVHHQNEHQQQQQQNQQQHQHQQQQPPLPPHHQESSSSTSQSSSSNSKHHHGHHSRHNGHGHHGHGHHHRKQHASKMDIYRRVSGNGIQKYKNHKVSEPNQSQAFKDSSKHTVTYTYSRNQTVIVEYAPDPSQDMFQEKATKWQRRNGEVDGLTTNGILILNPKSVSNGQHQTLSDQHSGTGGHSSNDIEPENVYKAPVREGERGMYVWREVSVDGDIYTLRETRSAQKRGDLVRQESNCLEDGSLIDLCGATLLWRSKEGLDAAPTRAELEDQLDAINAGKPTCPVNLNTLVIPRRRGGRGKFGATHGNMQNLRQGFAGSQQDGLFSSERQPYVYIACGHVQGEHSWGHKQLEPKGIGSPSLHKCPICNAESERIIGLCMGMEPTFHLDAAVMDHAFLPCGHMASKQTVRYWSRIPVPHGTNSFYPVCPFCCTQLSTPSKPYIRLHLDFQG